MKVVLGKRAELVEFGFSCGKKEGNASSGKICILEFRCSITNLDEVGRFGILVCMSRFAVWYLTPIDGVGSTLTGKDRCNAILLASLSTDKLGALAVFLFQSSK